MKHYIFLMRITGSGGVQCYVSSMTKCLEQKGWHVVVISDNAKDDDCLIPSLKRYLLYSNRYTYYHPHQIPLLLVKKALNQMLKSIGEIKKDDQVIVESWNSSTALWGELLAKKVHGRHMFWTANEKYRGDGKAYLEKIDFFQYKMDRGEILGAISTVNRLFEGYRVYKSGDFVECISPENPVQDVESERIDSIYHGDWNICYIGRSNKPYVLNVIKGVSDFSNKHLDKDIQFILVGNAEEHHPIFQSLKPANLSIVELGDQYPIPRRLFNKVDVVIAGSGSARHSADEGVLTIIADPETCDSRGLLGYDTLNSVYETDSEITKECHFSFSEALERALVLQSWKGQVNRWPKSPSVEEGVENHLAIIASANPDLQYYDEKKILKGKVRFKELAKALLK